MGLALASGIALAAVVGEAAPRPAAATGAAADGGGSAPFLVTFQPGGSLMSICPAEMMSLEVW